MMQLEHIASYKQYFQCIYNPFNLYVGWNVNAMYLEGTKWQ